MTVTARIGVRAATTADAESVVAIYAPVVTGTAISFEETAPGPDEIRRRMLASPRLPWLVADDAGRVVGYAYASTHRQRPAYRWSADCSVYLDPAYRARGTSGGRGTPRGPHLRAPAPGPGKAGGRGQP
jgi:phosphinothricin acetyltransferase